jgi:FdhD protein
MNESTVSVNIQKRLGSNQTLITDTLAVEEPLEIRVGLKTVSITMRTPGHDRELAAGFLFTEGLIQSFDQILKIENCGPALSQAQSQNVVKVELKPEVEIDLKRLERHFYTSSSCGVCGKTSIEALQVKNHYKIASGRNEKGPFVSAELINALPEKARKSQNVFDRTGGLHASTLFSAEGQELCIREDVGRHNALDKLIGWACLENRLPLDEAILFVSGRASFELIQKAVTAGIRIFAAVGAPSSLAVELARESNLTLLGFVRDQRFNIYHGDWRIRSS